MNVTVRGIASILGYNTWLFGNAARGVDASHSSYRINEHTNKFDRLAGHITVGRYGMAQMLQIQAPAPDWGSFAEFGVGKQFEDASECPPLADIAAAFHRITETFMMKLSEVPEAMFANAATLPVPGDNPTMLDQLAFLAMHESYHLGQLGLLKKSMGGRELMSA